MHWITATLTMFAASVVLYLFVRKAALAKLPVYFNNLALFAIPEVVFVIGAIVTHASFAMTLKQALIVFAVGIVAYASSATSLKSIELAPNPGYSLVISKSYVVLTTFVAVPLLGAHLSWQALMAVLLIVGFSTLIILGGKSQGAKSPAWLPLALVPFFGWAFLSLAAKYLFSEGMSTWTYLSCFYAVVTICIFAEMHIKRVGYRQLWQHWRPFLWMGLASSAFNFFNFYAINLAPNVGYVNAANAASIAAVTVFAALIFKDDLSIKKVIGVFGVVAGLFLLFLG